MLVDEFFHVSTRNGLQRDHRVAQLVAVIGDEGLEHIGSGSLLAGVDHQVNAVRRRKLGNAGGRFFGDLAREDHIHFFRSGKNDLLIPMGPEPDLMPQGFQSVLEQQ